MENAEVQDIELDDKEDLEVIEEVPEHDNTLTDRNYKPETERGHQLP